MKHSIPIIFLCLGVIIGLQLDTLFGDANPGPFEVTEVASHDLAHQDENIKTQLQTVPPAKQLPLDGEIETFDQLTVPPSKESVNHLLTEEGKILIEKVRTNQTPIDIYNHEKNDEALCAGYIYDLTRLLRGDLAPSDSGMYHPEKRNVCDAREMPYCYRRRGGQITYDIGDAHGAALKKDPRRFPHLVSSAELVKFFVAAFQGSNVLSDIGFLFHDTTYLHKLGEYGNYNSHLAKNMGVSTFRTVIQNPNLQAGNDLVLRESLGCTEGMRNLLKPVFKHYAITINDRPARYLGEGQIVVRIKDGRWIPYQFQLLDTISYQDIALAHFYEGEKIDSLLEMSCQGIFYPINVIDINPKFLETM